MEYGSEEEGLSFPEFLSLISHLETDFMFLLNFGIT